MKTNDLPDNPKNPRKISDEKIALLRKRMQTFGDLSGIIFNKKTSHLVTGHQRKKIFSNGEVIVEKRFKKPTPQGTVAEGYILFNDEKFHYREVEWSEALEKAAMVSANVSAGQFDEGLTEILMEIDTGEFDLDLSGFTKTELDKMFSGDPENTPPHPADGGAGGVVKCPKCGHEFEP